VDVRGTGSGGVRGGGWVTLSDSRGSSGSRGGITPFWARGWDELARVVLLDAEEVLLCVAPDLNNIFGLDAGLNLPPVPAMGSERVEKQPVLVGRPRLTSLRDDVCLARPLGRHRGSCCCCRHCLRARVSLGPWNSSLALTVGGNSGSIFNRSNSAIVLRRQRSSGVPQDDLSGRNSPLILARRFT
jgi:hypothetical protein